MCPSGSGFTGPTCGDGSDSERQLPGTVLLSKPVIVLFAGDAVIDA